MTVPVGRPSATDALQPPAAPACAALQATISDLGLLPDHLRFNLGYLGTETVRVDPNRVAVIDEVDGVERTISYGQLDRQLNRVANLFAACGLRCGDRVAIMIGNRREFIEAVYGALRAGLIPVIVNTKLGHAGLSASISQTGAIAAVVDPDCNESAMAVAVELAIERRFLIGAPVAGWSDFAQEVAARKERFEPIRPFSSTAIADLCFTSGSSGTPKAVMTSHRAILMKLQVYGSIIRAMVGGTIRTLVALPIFHANGRLSIGTALQTGGLIVIQPRFNARAALERIAGHRITYFLGVAPAYAAMLKETEALSRLDFSSLRYLWVGAASSSSELLRQVAEALDVQVIHTYGSTEGGVNAQAEPRTSGFESCGTPFPGVETRLVDPATGEDRSPGELWVRCEWLASGYWGLPELTRSRFVDGWYRTGDLFVTDEHGRMFFRGRADDTFNVGGEKVHPTDVEVLLQAHPDVLSAAVVAIPHEEKGQVPAAMVVLRPGARPSVDDLKAHCIRNGPAYAHPRRILLVDAFPVAATGKIDKRAIRAAFGDADSSVEPVARPASVSRSSGVR
jgi:acyl-CoA synthetase (AMP-forming)/AMP-acid ligase II